MELNWIIDKIHDETEETIRSALQKTVKNAKAEAMEIRQKIIKDWFEGFDHSPWSTKRVNIVKARTSSEGMHGKLVVNTWTDPSLISDASFESAHRYLEYHNGYLPPNLYVSDLVFDEGIIGLPKTAWTTPGYTGRGWENGYNKFFFQKEPLGNVLNNSSMWDAYEEKITREILSKIK